MLATTRHTSPTKTTTATATSKTVRGTDLMGLMWTLAEVYVPNARFDNV